MLSAECDDISFKRDVIAKTIFAYEKYIQSFLPACLLVR